MRSSQRLGLCLAAIQLVEVLDQVYPPFRHGYTDIQRAYPHNLVVQKPASGTELLGAMAQLVAPPAG